MKNAKVVFEPNAHLSAKEKVLLKWLIDNFTGQITILAESRQDGTKMPDILCNGRRIELKTTSGNLSTLDTLIRKASKQAQGECVIVNLVKVPYSLHSACEVILRRMQRSGLKEVYLLKDGTVQAHLQQNPKEGTR